MLFRLYIILLALLSVLQLQTASSTSPKTTQESGLEEVFHQFIKEYKKNYVPGSSEYRYRFRMFKNSLERIRARNEKRTSPNSALYGITRFADLSPKEFQRKLIFGQFKRSKYSLKAKYLPNGDRFRYSEHYYSPKGTPPLPTFADHRSPAELPARVYHEEQRYTQQLQKPEVNDTRFGGLSNSDMRTKIKDFRQVFVDWPDEHFDRDALVKQAKLNVHEHLLHLDLMQRMLEEKRAKQDLQSKFLEEKESPERESDCTDEDEQKVKNEEDFEKGKAKNVSGRQLTSVLTSALRMRRGGMTEELSEEMVEKKANKIREELMKSIPSSFPRKKDWRDDGVIGDVVDQGVCGGCWAISAVQMIESMYAIKQKMHKVVPLSIQQMLDCSKKNYGCEGGDTCNGLRWMIDSNIKLGTRAQYPSRPGESGECLNQTFNDGIGISNYTCNDFSSTPFKLLRLLAFHGPVASAVDATSWQDYLGGIVQFNCNAVRNHAVLLVGYDLTGPTPFYIVKNSWGPEFGLNGYLHVAIGGNLCDIENKIATVNVL